MSRRRLSPERYRAICVVALALLAVIVVSGGLVRLTGSGLGCDDWPNCNDTKIIDVSSTHSAIEQINRLFTGLVALGVVLAVAGSVIREPRRRDLTWLSWGLVAGVIGQVVLGGITVLVDLHPAAVQSHFLLSMVLIANATVLVYRAGLPDRRRVPRVSTTIRRHVWAIGAMTSVAITLGTVVTGSGPHAGDEEARRFGFDIGQTARVHSASVWITVGLAAWLMWRLRDRPADREVLETPIYAWIGVAVLQGGVGYLQYFSGIPVALVAIHLALATALYVVTVWMIETMKTSHPGAGAGAGEGSEQRAQELGGLVDDGREEAADVVDEVVEHVRGR
ncbi:MAG: COX15/CtaA family protein [Acidimicrobiales bacterium]